jgi:drug/metabolite transporter (DMT)-like permease
MLTSLSSLRGGLLILIGALFWSTGGVGIKLLDGYGATAVTGGRSLVCAVFFLAFLRGRFLPEPGVRRWVIAGALCYAGLVSCFVAATKFTTAANAIYLEATTPLWIALLGWTFARERPLPRELLALVCGGLGVGFCITSGPPISSAPSSPTVGLTGDMLALTAGFAFALLTLILRRLSRDYAQSVPAMPPAAASATTRSTPPAYYCLFYGNLLAALVCFPALRESLAHPGVTGMPVWVGWLILLWLGAGQLGLGYWCYQCGLRTTRALTAGILGLVEPLLNPVWVAMGVGEIPARGTLLGGLFILLSIGVSIVAPGRKS